MKLIARHQIIFGSAQSAMPGEVFELPAEDADRLVDSGAADFYVEPKLAAAPPAAPASRKGKATSADADL